MAYQQLMVVGNLGADPELRFTQSGKAVCSFSVAVSERWTKDGEKREKTTWFRVSAWDTLGETCKRYLAKGKQVMVIGTVSASAYTAKDGTPGASLELTARDVRFLSPADETGGDETAEDFAF